MGGGTDMAKRCAICGKEPVAGNNVAHSKKATRRWWKPNVHKVKAVMKDGSVKRIKVCTSCLKAGKVKRA
ncbi:MAG: large subunit ribosomal protein [Geotoga sp.]|jgi:large subunit ribosomal protein L28|nr:large subunit ribosomal protein [Geotoga sp.]